LKLISTTARLAACFALYLAPTIPGVAQPVGGALVRDPTPYSFPAFTAEKNPLVFTKATGERLTILRSPSTTCGAYTLAVVDLPPDAGPPPHIHYASEEWFYLPEGSVTMFVQVGGHEYHAGQRPGANTPKVTLNAFALPAGQLVYAPPRMVHAFRNESQQMVRRFINVWSPGSGMTELFQELQSSITPTTSDDEAARLLEQISSKWGVPHDPRGTFAEKVVRAAPPHAHDNQAARFEEMIRSAERCNPDGVRP
jgi:oxalate decarboxylase/phosphoglucose isomerase-like protein (cupin superfamily)